MFWYIIAMALGSKPPLDEPAMPPPPPEDALSMFWYIIAIADGSNMLNPPMPLVALNPPERAPPGALNDLTCVPAPRGCAFLISIWGETEWY